MLVLDRNPNEVICIGDDIRVTVVRVRGDKVRLGIDAPKHIAVHRLEVYNAIHHESSEGRWADDGGNNAS